VLRRFGITRAVSDKYAGAWPVSRFAEYGITLEQSARGKSDIYHDFLALANARRVELLDHPRMAAQFIGLERRVARSGKDSIAEPPNAHDDIANSVAGVLVGLDLDRRPAMVRQADLLGVDGGPLPLPTSRCLGIMATLAVSRTGMAAEVYVGIIFRGPALVLDYEIGPLSGTLFEQIMSRLAELAGSTHAQHIAGLWVQPDFVRQAYVVGIVADPIPEQFLDADLLFLPAAGHIAAGRGKLCEPAHVKAQTCPFGGALDFRGGDGGDDPLRRAALWAIALSLDPQ
jgi:hypothetical protein